MGVHPRILGLTAVLLDQHVANWYTHQQMRGRRERRVVKVGVTKDLPEVGDYLQRKDRSRGTSLYKGRSRLFAKRIFLKSAPGGPGIHAV